MKKVKISAEMEAKASADFEVWLAFPEDFDLSNKEAVAAYVARYDEEYDTDVVADAAMRYVNALWDREIKGFSIEEIREGEA